MKHVYYVVRFSDYWPAPAGSWNETAVSVCINGLIEKLIAYGPQYLDDPVYDLTDCEEDRMSFAYVTSSQDEQMVTVRVWIAALRIIRAFARWYDGTLFKFEVYEYGTAPEGWEIAPIDGDLGFIA